MRILFNLNITRFERVERKLSILNEFNQRRCRDKYKEEDLENGERERERDRIQRRAWKQIKQKSYWRGFSILLLL